MKKLFIMLLTLASVGLATYACAGKGTQRQNQPNKQTETSTQTTAKGEVITLDKAMFLKKICNYEQEESWKFLGDKPAIIDFYADWCGPCRMVAPIMQELAKEYANEIVIYKINVDKERELAALFNATSIPLFIFIPMDEAPQILRGAADKATYKQAIDEFLLKKAKQK